MDNLLNSLPVHILAQQYNCNAYGEGAYQTCETSGSSQSNGSSGSSLADTGLTVGIFILVAVAVLFFALLVRFWRRKRQAKPTTSKTSSKPKTDE